MRRTFHDFIMCFGLDRSSEKNCQWTMILGHHQNIVRHWQQITEKRTREYDQFFPKYFQYLALLFTEIYLDRYFRDTNELLVGLNAFSQEFNSDKPAADHVRPYKLDDLNKLAFWQATGSGKTLLMHVNISVPPLFGFSSPTRRTESHHPVDSERGVVAAAPPRVSTSGMDAELFSREGRGLFAGHSVEIIEVHKLKDEMGEKTVAIDAFEGSNLVLVDEGHRGQPDLNGRTNATASVKRVSPLSTPRLSGRLSRLPGKRLLPRNTRNAFWSIIRTSTSIAMDTARIITFSILRTTEKRTCGNSIWRHVSSSFISNFVFIASKLICSDHI